MAGRLADIRLDGRGEWCGCGLFLSAGGPDGWLFNCPDLDQACGAPRLVVVTQVYPALVPLTHRGLAGRLRLAVSAGLR